MTWTSVQLNPPFADEILAASNSVSDALSAVNDFLGIIKELLELARALSFDISANPIEEAIRLLIAEIDRFLAGLLQSTRVHAIFIPIQKVPLTPAQLRGQQVVQTLIDPDVNEDDRYDSFDEMLEENAFSGATEVDETLIDFIDNSPSATAGNRGFWRVLAESTRDIGDGNRPTFTPDFAVAGTTLVFGSTDMAELYRIFELIGSLLALGARSDLSGRTNITVQNLRALALPITVPEDENNPASIGVSLTWDKLGPAITFPAFSSDQQVVVEYLVIRSTSPQLREAYTWSQVFSRQPSFVDTSDLPEEGNSKVIARIPNDGFVTGYLDEDPELIEGAVYYYSVVARIEVNVDADFETDVILPISNLSNVVRIEVRRPGDSKGGEPPDWIGTPSLASLFPALEALINQIRLALSQLGSFSLSGPNILDEIISQIEGLVTRSEQVVAILNEINNRLAALLTSDVSGIYATTFSVPVGGIDGWLGELARRLSDPADNTRPPFDNNELVAGVVVVGGAPTLPALDPLLSLLELFFGGSSSNTLLSTINEIDNVVTATERRVFGEDMTVSTVPLGTPEEDNSAKVVFDDAMQPVDSVNCN